ncbi:UvrD-helicase domain-containing protein [Idiomarina loihiensis]|uniref:UvrD-helicase domain-containing protein n=3 Tax=Idiomarina TaxID=135575 RepID=UPI00211D46DA|nr:UvrD-helicase domain-containing protein [Idiomarina loihiensis]UUN13070.1 UvrD-helicase domain-containing protein [Idiomarina loihiensis]
MASNNVEQIKTIELHPNWVGKLFGDYTQLTIDADSFYIEERNCKQTLLGTFDELATLPTTEKGLFWSSLTITLVPNKRYIFSFITNAALTNALPKIQQLCLPALQQRIYTTYQQFQQNAIKQYLRDSTIPALETQLNHLLPLAKVTQFEATTRQQLQFMLGQTPISEHADNLRETYEKRTLATYQSFYDKAEANPLTHSQRLAVIRNNDFNLVLAAAGTGKTSVMVAKALDLIVNHGVKPHEILVLAYNRAAANELQERFNKRAKAIGTETENESNTPSIATFHALGRAILKQANHTVHLSKFTDDPKKLNQWVTQWLINQLRELLTVLEKLFSLVFKPVNPFDFETQEDYENYVRDNEYRTLNGELVKGYQELIIANWLCRNGIEYQYESPYKSKRRIAEGVDYKPDFYLTEADIYLEHFGVDRHGKTRPDIDRQKYNQEMELKRNLHRECGTKLIETYHYDWVEGKLEQRLEQLMRENNVKLQPLTDDELLEKLNNSDLISTLAEVLYKSLQAIRTEQLDDEGISARLAQLDNQHANWCAAFLTRLHESYQQALREENAIDFDDMILQAQAVVQQNQFKPKWRHILVDEFQDISAARLGLVKTLIKHGPNPTMTAVGDDWQSIYRFSGGKLEITTRFGEYLGTHSLTKLDKTFRYNNSIADTAGNFVMENPEQYKKQVETHTKVSSPQVYLLDSLIADKPDPAGKVAKIIAAIREHAPDDSIAIICRYNYLLNDVRENLKHDAELQDGQLKNINYWTFHKSKGLEADHCILVGFFQGKVGFPNENKGHYIVEALLPTLDSFKHSEERRLFYVGLTRARKKSYLVADPHGMSAFIKEILTPKYDIAISSERFREKFQEIFKCPKCTNGYLKRHQGQYGAFYRCTTGNGCSVRPRVCSACGSPTIDHWFHSICNNPDCRGETPICDKCGRPMKQREGRYGKFWGCTGYGIKDDQCRHTRKWLP